ncbi:MEDS domain-containing protein [Streptomyces stramineus]
MLFASDEERASILRGFVLGGLGAQHKIVYLSGADGPRGPRALLEQCRLTGAPPHPDGQLEVLGPADAGLRPGEWDPALLLRRLRAVADRSRREGYRALRVTGDPPAVPADEPGLTRLLRYESLLAEEFAPGRPWRSARTTSDTATPPRSRPSPRPIPGASRRTRSSARPG